MLKVRDIGRWLRRDRYVREARPQKVAASVRSQHGSAPSTTRTKRRRAAQHRAHESRRRNFQA